MSIGNEIINAVNFYQVLKKDLHTLLVKKSKVPFDYEGKLTLSDDCQPLLKYSIEEDYQNSEMYHALISVGILLESMLKNDVRLWNKTEGIEMIRVAPDYRCETIILDVRFHD